MLDTNFADNELLSAVELYVGTVRKTFEEKNIYPRLNMSRDVVLLALFDKVLGTAQAVLHLVKGGFPADAFGLSRTAVEAFLALRYVENDDSERRAKRYTDYFAKDYENLQKIVSKHHPALDVNWPADSNRLRSTAKTFKSAHKWMEENVKELAYEKSTWALDENGKPQSWEYSYDAVYKFTSHEVHATAIALHGRLQQFYESSRYPGAFKFSTVNGRRVGGTAVFNVWLHLHAAAAHICHAFDLKIPDAVDECFRQCEAAFIEIPH